MKKKIIILFVMAIFITGCQFRNEEEKKSIQTENIGSTKVLETPQKTESTKTVEISREKENIDSTEALKMLSKGVNQFSYQLYDEMEEGENMCISPYSIVSALSMLDNGAAGNTKKELEKVLGIEDIALQNQALKKYVDIQKQKKNKLYWANSVWISDELPLENSCEKDFFQPLQQYYNAEKYCQSLYTDKIMEQVNLWVSQKTEGMIKKLLSEPLNPDTALLLLNTLYFQGEWETSFLNEGDRMQFQGKNKTTLVSKMKQEDIHMKYITKYGLQGVEIPYKNDTFVMDVFLPMQERNNAITLFQNMNLTEKDKLFLEFEKTKKQEIKRLVIPKFTIEYDVDSKKLKNALIKQGIVDAFSAETADFSPITTKYPLYINEIVHKTKLEVQEKGTKAAAVTAVIMKNSMRLEEEGVNFIVNQPFLYVIRDTSNGMILFIGSVQDLEEELEE